MDHRKKLSLKRNKERTFHNDAKKIKTSTEDKNETKGRVVGKVKNDVIIYQTTERIDAEKNEAEKKCELISTASSANHLKYCLQNFSHTTVDDAYKCHVCKKDITHMNSQRRSQHVNKCIDSRTGPESKNAPEEVFDCPFCVKKIGIDKKILHLKQCGQSKGFGAKELSNIAQLLERQAEERRVCGLPALTKKQFRNKSISYKKGNKFDSDIEMAMALSLSLEEEQERKYDKEMQQLGIPVMQRPQCSKVMLENKIRQKNGKERCLESLPILMTRTPNDRKEIIANRIAEILEEKSCMEVVPLADIINVNKQPRHLESYLKQHSISNCILWKKASLHEYLIAQNDFYVSQLQPIISPKKDLVRRQKSKGLSQFPGRESSQISVAQKPEIFEQLTPSALSDQVTEDNYETTKQNCFISNIDEQSSGFFYDCMHDDHRVHSPLDGQNSQPCSIMKDFFTMVGNPELSDVTIYIKDHKSLPAHRFVLYARCLHLYQDLRSNWDGSNKFSLNWFDVSERAARTLLTFLYCGQLTEQENDVMLEVMRLAERYNILDLKTKVKTIDLSTVNEVQLEDISNQMESVACINQRLDCISPELLPIENDTVLNNEIKGSYLTFSNNIEHYTKEAAIEEAYIHDFKKSILSPEVQPLINIDKSPSKKNIQVKAKESIECQWSSSFEDPDYLKVISKMEMDSMTDLHKNVNNHIPDLPVKATPTTSFYRKSFSQPVSNLLQNEYISPYSEVWQDFDNGGYFDYNSDYNNSPIVEIDVLENKSYEEKQDGRPVLDKESPVHKISEKRENDTSRFPTKFTSVSESRLQITPQIKQKNRNIRLKKKCRISQSQPISSEVTPMPHYQDMDTPEIKAQLNKYGIRVFTRTKAVKILKHVYNETHPLVYCDERGESSLSNDLNMKSDISHELTDDQNNEQIKNSSQSSSSSAESVLEESLFVDEESSTISSTISYKLKEFLKEKHDLFKKILTYEALNIHDLHKDIKNSGIKISLPDLKDFLDEQCITFSLPRDRPMKTRQKKKK